MPTIEKPSLSIEETSRNVTTVRLVVDSAATWEQWVLLRSDVHWDNPHCNRAMEKRHLDQVVERNAVIIDCGDLFCAMQGKYDKRSDKSSVRPEHQSGNYLDALVNTAIEYYTPYANYFAVIGRGNHETKIKENRETDLTDRLVAGLREQTGAGLVAGGYTHWTRFHVHRCHARASLNIWQTHGYGGGGPVTQDMIQGNRQRVYIENADVMLSGHTHDSWMMDSVRLKLNKAGVVERRLVTQLKLPTYKDAYGDGYNSWEVQKGMPPKPLGAYWMRLFWDCNPHAGLRYEITRTS